MTVRLNKFLADRGVASRRHCDRLIAEGRVSVNGRRVSEAGTKVEEMRDRVSVDGRPVGGRETHVYYVLNKPVGVITTLDDPEGRRTVRELLPRGARVFPVGRLDADTSGLLLLTNDGELAHRLMHPRYGVVKVYRVRLGREPRADQLRRLAAGVRFGAGAVSAPARVRRIDPGFDAIMIEVAVHEGRFRQVRRMCEAVGLEVTGLHRVGYGPLRLGPLARGMYRELSEDEVGRLRSESARPGGTGPRERPRGAGPRAGKAERAPQRAPGRPPGPKRASRPGREAPETADGDLAQETWIPGGGVLEADPAPGRRSAKESAAEGWPARATPKRGDTAWRPDPAGESERSVGRPGTRGRAESRSRPPRARRPRQVQRKRSRRKPR